MKLKINIDEVAEESIEIVPGLIITIDSDSPFGTVHISRPGMAGIELETVPGDRITISVEE